jgi:hypothetical protein
MDGFRRRVSLIRGNHARRDIDPKDGVEKKTQ